GEQALAVLVRRGHLPPRRVELELLEQRPSRRPRLAGEVLAEQTHHVKARKVTGRAAAARAARRGSATCIRSARAAKDGRPSTRATTSPSRSMSSYSSASGASSGQESVTSRPDRLVRVRRPPFAPARIR